MSVVLSEHLPLLATTPDGIEKIRGLILELAVRGKLVPQDPNDEPASELLMRIAKERARLEAEGVCKKSKAMPLVCKGDQPLELPDSWEWARLGVVSVKLTDGSHNPPPDVGSGIPMLSSQNVQDGWIAIGNPSRYLSEDDFALEDSRTRVEAGDVLLTIVASIGRSAVVTKDHGRFALQRSVAVIRSCLASEFLSLQLRAPIARRYYDQHGKGTAQKGIYLGKLGELPIAVPPLAEQHRIVAKVDELMALCDRLEAEQTDAETAHARLVETLLGTLTQSTDATDLAANWQRLADHFDTLFTTESSLDALKQTILQLAVMGKLVPQDPKDEPASELLKRIAKERARLEAEGICKKSKPMPPVGEDEQPFVLPDGWHWVRFSSYALEISTGPFGSMLHQSDYRPGGIPLVNPSHMIGGRIVPESHIAVGEGKAIELSSYRLQCGDIVMARRGEVGRTALVTEAEDGWLCGTGSFVIRLAKDVSRTYVVMLFRTSSIRRYLGNEAVGTTMVNLNHGILNAMPLALPPLAEQHRIVAKVDELMALCDRLKADLAESRSRQDRLATTLIESALAAA